MAEEEGGHAALHRRHYGELNLLLCITLIFWYYQVEHKTVNVLVRNDIVNDNAAVAKCKHGSWFSKAICLGNWNYLVKFGSETITNCFLQGQTNCQTEGNPQGFL